MSIRSFPSRRTLQRAPAVSLPALRRAVRAVAGEAAAVERVLAESGAPRALARQALAAEVETLTPTLLDECLHDASAIEALAENLNLSAASRDLLVARLLEAAAGRGHDMQTVMLDALERRLRRDDDQATEARLRERLAGLPAGLRSRLVVRLPGASAAELLDAWREGGEEGWKHDELELLARHRRARPTLLAALISAPAAPLGVLVRQRRVIDDPALRALLVAADWTGVPADQRAAGWAQALAVARSAEGRQTAFGQLVGCGVEHLERALEQMPAGARPELARHDLMPLLQHADRRMREAGARLLASARGDAGERAAPARRGR